MARSITRWEPLTELAEMRSRFDRLFGELMERPDREWSPATDVVRDNGDLIVRIDVPGIKPDEIEIQCGNGMLTISGKHEETKEEKDQEFLRRERRYGSFLRSMPLPEGVDAKRIKAETRNGVLELKIPLPEEAAQEPVTIKPTPAK